MAESSKLRLVRCPKCENLLPELPDYSVYQCGGCGAVLRAKKGTLEGGNESQRCDDERIRVVSDKSENILSDSENFVEKGTEKIENGEVKLNDCKMSDETVGERFGNDLKREVGKWVFEDENSNKSGMGNGNVEPKTDKLETHVENGVGLRGSVRMFERRMSARGEEEQFGKIRKAFERVTFSSFNEVGEGTSKYNLDSSCRNEGERGTKAEYVVPDREELLRKLDELKEQLSRVQNGNDKPHEKRPLEHRMAHVEPYAEADDYFHSHPTSFNRVSRQFSAPNKHIPTASRFEHYHEPFPVPNRSDMSVHNYHGPMHYSNHGPRYEDSFDSQMFRIPPPRRIRSHHQYMASESECFDPHAYHMSLHQFPCSCCQCYDRQAQVPLQMPSSAFGNRRFPHVVNKAVPCLHEPPTTFGSHGYNPRVVTIPPVGSCDPPSHSKWPGGLNREMGGFSRARPQRMVLPNGHCCQPVVGGAPFVTCHNCFELLKLPKKVNCKKGEWTMSCGVCSLVNSFAIVDGKLVSVNTSLKQSTTEALSSSNDVGRSHGKRDNASFCSEDYANSVYDFQAMDRGPVSSSTCQGVSSSKSERSSKAEETHNRCSISATTSEDDQFSDDFISRQGVTSTAEPPEVGVTPPSPLESPPQDPVDYSSKYRAVNRCGKGSLSSRSDQEIVMANKSTLRQNSLKESLATEMDISPNDYANTGMSQDTTDVSREDEQPKVKKGVDSFLAGIIKKSFRDFSKSNQSLESGKRNVSVNGHLIPDRLVKKAEKLAGPIYPGQYWYDYRAGFWGVMGGPCLGIIPPYVEEFNYPIPENCAGGNTGVFVNGRELHQKDLDLLSTRGLPVARGGSYIVEISGRVVDEDSGEELDSLGKLAPTVEKVKHGFGMRAPKAST